MESVQCRLIPSEVPTRDYERSKPLEFTNLEISPYPLVKGANYIITSWNSNTYITATGVDTFEIKEHHGAKLCLDKEYLFIRPMY